MSSSNPRCAACKFLRRKCSQECVFAPYFPPDQAQKFANVHKVFGASNVAKLLNDLSPVQREDAVNSLAYEADARLRDPVYGCVGLISILQEQLKQVQLDLISAKKELANYIGTSAVLPYNMLPMLGFRMNQDRAMPLVMRDYQQKQHLMEAHQSSVAEIWSYKQQQQFNNVFDTSGQVTASGFDQAIAGGLAMSLALESYEDPYHHQILEQQSLYVDQC
ncbi:hypothetical protein ACET3Z_022659 [Daucus carota]